MRRRVLPAVLLFAVAVAAAAAVVVVAHDGASRVTAEEFLMQVHGVCENYARQLDEIAPPTDLSSPGAVYESIGLALPVLREQEREIRALDPPQELLGELEEFYALTDRSLVELATARRMAGERELFPMATALTRYEDVRDEAKTIARRIGLDC